MIMNKIFNYTLLALLAVVTFGVSSCKSEDGDYSPVAPEENMRAYFSEASQSIELMTDQNVISVPLFRVEQGEKIAYVQESLFQESDSVHYNYPEAVVDVTLNDPSGSGLFSLKSNKVKFAEGSNVASVDVVFDFDQVAPDTEYKVELGVADPAVQSLYGFSTSELLIKYAPWSDWAPWGEGTGSYTYANAWSGTDTGMPIFYRESLIPGSTMAQFRIDNWGGGKSLYIDYDKETHQCYIPEQYTGADYAAGDGVYAADVPTWQGNEALRAAGYDSYYDPEAGLFVLQMCYYCSAGYFGYDPEYFQCDGFYQPDYNVYMTYKGAFKDTKDKTGAIVSFAKGVDVASYKYVLLDGTYSEDLADKLAAIIDGDADNELGAIASDEDGMKMFGIEADGDYTVATANYDADGNLVGGNVCAFTYEAPGGAKWESIGLCKYTDDLIGPLFEAEPISYDVEVRVKADKPGIYRMVNPYGATYPYNKEGDYDASQDYFIDINAVDPEGVYIEEQATGCDWGYGNMTIMSMGYYYMAAGNSFEAVKAAGYMGTLKDNVITFPVKGMLVGDDDGRYYGNQNGAFSLNLNPANAKARAAKAHVSISKAHKAGKSDLKMPEYRKAVNVHVYKISREQAWKGLQLRKNVKL